MIFNEFDINFRYKNAIREYHKTKSACNQQYWRGVAYAYANILNIPLHKFWEEIKQTK